MSTSEQDWKKHWFVLTGNSLRYYKDAKSQATNQLDGLIDLSSCFEISEVLMQRNYGFKIKTRNGEYILSAITSGIRSNWMKAIRLCMDLQASNKSSPSGEGGTATPLRTKDDMEVAPVSVPEVTAKVTDGDKQKDDDDKKQRAKSTRAQIKKRSQAKSPKLHSPPTGQERDNKFTFRIAPTGEITAVDRLAVSADDMDVTDGGGDIDNMHLDGDENLTSTMSSAGENMLVDLLENEDSAMEIEINDDESLPENFPTYDDSELFSHEDHMGQSRKLEPLMPESVKDEMEALEHFTKVFRDRYGECHPVFYIGSLDNAIRDSLFCSAKERKQLAIYLHHDGSILSNVFCSKTLCNEGVVNFLTSNFIIWAWDMTLDTNHARLTTLATHHFGSVAATQIRGYSPDNFPVLFIISRSRMTNKVADVIRDVVTVDELMSRLIQDQEVFSEQQQKDIVEETKEIWELNGKEKMDQCDMLKEKGTMYFKKQNFVMAEQFYRNVVENLEHDTCMEGPEADRRHALLIVGNLNVAIVCLRQEQWAEATRRCDAALKLDPHNEKALYRRAEAAFNTKEFVRAKQDYVKVLEVNPQNKTAKNKVNQCDVHIKKMADSEKQLCQKMLSISPNKPDSAMEIEINDDESLPENFPTNDDSELFSHEDHVGQSRKLEHLMPESVKDEMEALELFTKVFRDRYGECHPVFYIGSLDNAIRDSLFCSAKERKQLAIYLHHDGSILSNVFCSQTLCNEGVVNFLTRNFIVWAWDMTLDTNHARLTTLATRHFGSVAATQIRGYSPDNFPVLFIISRSRMTNKVADVIRDVVTVDELMSRLIQDQEVFSEQQQKDVVEETAHVPTLKQEADMPAQTKRQKSSDAYRMLFGTCPDEEYQAKLYFPSNDKSIECTNCGQRHEKSLLQNVAEVTGLSNYVCKLISPILTKYGMDRKLGKAIPLKDMGKGEVFNCGQILGDREFLIEEENLDVIGYGKDRSGSIHYLDDTLNDIRSCNDNETRLIPIHVDGDGHCLVYAISRALVGRELFWHALRVNLGLHIRDNLASYKQLFKDFIDAEEWEDIIDECDPYYIPPEGQPIGLRNIHIFGLANVLHRPIILLDSKSGMQSPGDYSGVFVPGLVSPEDCRGKDGTLNKPLCIAWSSSGRNHYIPLVGIKGRGPAMLPAYMVQTAWGMPDESIKNYLELDNMDRCVVGGDKCLTDRYIRQLVEAMEEVFIEQNQVHPSLVAGVHLFMYKFSGIVCVQPDEVIQRTQQSVRDEVLYRCLTCGALVEYHMDQELTELAINIINMHKKLNPDKLCSFHMQDMTRTYPNTCCAFCSGEMLRLVKADGGILYKDGDRTTTPCVGGKCPRGYKHFWQGKEYDNLPELFPISLQWAGKVVSEKVVWFQNETDPAMNSNVYEVAQWVVQKHFPGEFGSERLEQQVVDTILGQIASADTASKIILTGPADKACDSIPDSRSSSSSEYKPDEEWGVERKKQAAVMEKDKGNYYFKRGDYDKAIECYTKGAELDPTNPLLPANRAVALLKQSKFAAAEIYSTVSLTLDPLYTKAYMRRGTARLRLAKFAAAKEDYERVLQLEPHNKEAKKAKTQLETIEKDKACDSIPDSRSSSSSEYKTDEEWEVERKKQAAVMEKDKGNDYFKRGDYANAIECYTKGAELDPTNPLLPANRAMALLKQSKFAAAEIDSTVSLTLDPLYTKAYMRRGTARLRLAKFAAAKEDYERVLQLEPHNKEAKKAKTHMESSKKDKACDSIPDSRSSSSEYETDEEREVERKKGAAVMEKDKDKACDSITDSRSSSSEYKPDEEWEVERKKQAAVMEKDKGNDYFKKGDYDNAIECYTKGAELDPTNPLLPANRAMALLKQSKFAAVEIDCTVSLTLDPLYTKAYLRRGTARRGLTKFAAAKEDYERVLQLEPHNKEAKKAKTELETIEKLSTMDDDYRTLSIHIWAILDRIGLSEDIRQTVNMASIKNCILHSLLQQLRGYEMVIYMFGSRVEATTTPDLCSDIDVVVCDDRIPLHVVDDVLDAPASGTCLLLVPDDTYPGYAKLQFVSDGTPMTGDGPARQKDPSGLFNIDNDGRVVRSQEFEFDVTCTVERCGPAITFLNNNLDIPIDMVRAYRCLKWPACATEWLTRDRPYNWPGKDQIEKLRLLGCLVVGVGHPYSPEQFLQWRISFSLQERDLMLKLNAVQYRCYVLMKFTKRDIMKPEIEDNITSYQCKTVLFYAIETTPAEFWEPQNLVKCFLYCLDALFKCVENGNCPNYFIPEANLFDRRLHGDLKLRRRVSSMLQKLLRENGRFLFRISCEDIGIQLSAAFNPEEQASTITSMSMKYANITKDIMYNQLLNFVIPLISTLNTLLIDAATDNDTTAAMQVLKDQIEQLANTTRVNGYSVEQTREAVDYILPFLHTVLASHMAADLLSSANTTVEAGSIRGPLDEHLQVSNDSGNIACRLKVAGIHYMLGEYKTSERILSEVAHEFDTCSVVINFCKCHKSGWKAQNDVLRNKITSGELSCRDVVNSCLSHDIRFLPTEMDVTPTALKYELFKSTGTLEGTRTQMESQWYEWGIVDGSVFLRYLQYLVYGKLGDVIRRRRAVEQLVNLATTDATIYHRETAINILGWIYKHEGNVNKAAMCFVESIRLQPVHNAAKWHIGDLYLRQAMAASQCPDTMVIYTRE